MNKKGDFYHVEGCVLQCSDKSELKISSSSDLVYDAAAGWQHVPVVKSDYSRSTQVWLKLSDGREMRVDIPGNVPIRDGHRIKVVFYKSAKDYADVSVVINENTRTISNCVLIGWNTGCFFNAVLQLCIASFVFGIFGICLSFMIPNRELWVKCSLAIMVPMLALSVFLYSKRKNYEAKRDEYVKSICV